MNACHARKTNGQADSSEQRAAKALTAPSVHPWNQYEAEQDRVLWELNEAAGAIAQHTPHEQRNFYYDTVAGAAYAFPVMSMRASYEEYFIYVLCHHVKFWRRKTLGIF
ncbi:hypothetical protein DPX16_18784 [Anabarilius grahami]|uniref:Uncharacterized protein n=1 Tax=Anabarilius grahami TaxID=495550 RepID=A0A3N0Y1S7_ANAGA|nr:hypothetical protein DPX16_18784 [Anabarilius grahami]